MTGRPLTRRDALWLTLALAAGVAALCGHAPTADAAAAIGAPAPPFTLVSADGRQVSLADFRGRTVVLEWTNHECPFVRKHYGAGAMQKLQKEARDAGVVWLTIISSAPGEQGHVTPEEARRLTVSRGAAPAAVLFDETGRTGRAYGAKTTPHMYVIGPDGALLYAGGIDDRPGTDPAELAGARNHVREALAEIAAGKPVSVRQSRPYGCAIKYAS
ncbi:thioredoxin family protein [Camelimonas abortus]|uniref:Thioredoxin family protein n=1 Tax=Camelimonas abortus TaxID=1017184 RepID=A0ABV7LE66_9HYPH